MKTNIIGAMTITAIFLAGFVSISYIGNVLSQGMSNEKSNMTAMSSNATSMEANITGANANSTNQTAPTAANTTIESASAPNASLSS